MTDRHVVVTGAAGGLGTQLVGDLVERGFTVSALDRHAEGLDRLTSAIPGVTGQVVDVTDSGSVTATIESVTARHGPPFGLVNLAGDNRLKPLAELTDDDWRYLVDANLTSAFYLCRAVMPLMRAAGGRVVNTSSIFGLRGADNDSAYAAAKAGIIGLTRALATEFAADNVTVNAVAPVVVLTERVRRMPSAHLEGQRARIPLGRFSEPADVTRTICFLLGEGGAFYTGQTFSPNGGDTMP
ncbi:hypothetical protein BAY61_19075 [Prauserella marina]|uniref:Acetoacetyl-CoA reductase/3-oxoacyl-[acyl-carrier protein] reductase n=1 Tax=Prauserella marina TaxID=530584 RepID=A0A222VSQ0_9PSEU|nr:SDR family NAD(P)-dependent oxidoreductase [Prauserella marina]ASR36751.1 hypothetical protein BAY61_19075 [Prauserella marina]PWV80359.1 acetoacetyl-CoA reductase/3-oxoacyl-[acyl-carrier protein] reductase [Prauserella marina]SDD52587.1 acetoacetyl-CoA reductase/3-oxoacyl-[acyl-carrier protein] reductase [Prauserella marina]